MTIPISSLPPAASLDGTEFFPVSQGGVTRKARCLPTGTQEGQIPIWSASLGRYVASAPPSGVLYTDVSLSFEDDFIFVEAHEILDGYTTTVV